MRHGQFDETIFPGTYGNGERFPILNENKDLLGSASLPNEEFEIEILESDKEPGSLQ